MACPVVQSASSEDIYTSKTSSDSIHYKPDPGNQSGIIVMDMKRTVDEHMIETRHFDARVVVNWLTKIFYVVSLNYNFTFIVDGRVVNYPVYHLRAFKNMSDVVMCDTIKDRLFGSEWHYHIGYKSRQYNHAVRSFARRTKKNGGDICEFEPITTPVTTKDIDAIYAATV